MILRTALKNIRNNFLLNLITCLQMAAAMIVTAILVSSILLRFQYYKPLEKYYSANGIYGIFSPFALDHSSYFLDDDSLKKELDNPIDVIGSGYILASLPDEKPCQSFAYTDNLVQSFTPDLAKGRWLSAANQTKTLECVVSQNDYGWDVGDDIEISFLLREGVGTYHFQIVGLLNENAKIPGSYYNNNADINFMQFYRTYSFETEEEPAILMNLESLKNLPDGMSIVSGMNCGYIITYPDSTSNEKLETECRKLASFGSVVSVPLQTIRPNHTRYLYRQTYDQLPIIIVLLILTCVSCISSSAITTRSRLHDYSIYYVCGLQWKHCTLINLVQSLICGTVSFLTSLSVLKMIKLIPQLQQFRVIWSWYTAGGMAAVLVIYIIASFIMPKIIIGHNTPKQILSR